MRFFHPWADQVAGWGQEQRRRYSARYKQLSRSLQSSRTNLFCVWVLCMWVCACGRVGVSVCTHARVCHNSDIPLQLFANIKGCIRSASWVVAPSRVNCVLQDVPWRAMIIKSRNKTNLWGCCLNTHFFTDEALLDLDLCWAQTWQPETMLITWAKLRRTCAKVQGDLVLQVASVGEGAEESEPMPVRGHCVKDVWISASQRFSGATGRRQEW